MVDTQPGLSGVNYDAFVSSQRTFSDHDLAAKIQEKYWQARQKFLSKVEKKEDSCIVLSDSKLDSKLEVGRCSRVCLIISIGRLTVPPSQSQVFRSIDKSSAKLSDILESYQNCLYVLANEENALGVFLKECSKIDKTKAGKVMAVAGKSLTQSSHQRIRLYMPLVRLYQEMETFHSRAVSDAADTVDKLESSRSKYRASLLWMKDISEKLNPDVYRELDKFRRVQNQVRTDKKAFDKMQMDVVQKIDLLMASRCNLMNQILSPYQAVLLETFETNQKSFESAESVIKKEDIHEYEFKTLKQLNPLPIIEEQEQPEENLLCDERPEDNFLELEQPGQNLLNFEQTEENILGGDRTEGNFLKLERLGQNLLNLEQPEENLLGEEQPEEDLLVDVPRETTSETLLNELDEIDKSSYFNSSQSLIQL